MTLADYINELRIRLEKTQGFVPATQVEDRRLNSMGKNFSAKKIKQIDHKGR